MFLYITVVQESITGKPNAAEQVELSSVQLGRSLCTQGKLSLSLTHTHLILVAPRCRRTNGVFQINSSLAVVVVLFFHSLAALNVLDISAEQ